MGKIRENDEEKIRVLSGSTMNEQERKAAFASSLRKSRISDIEILDNLGIYMTRQTLSRINFMQMLYTLIIPVHGVVMEFGVRWGQNMALFSNFRGIYEPFNYNRKIVGFDTFVGFPSVSAEDGSAIKPGDYSVPSGWRVDLEALLDFHEQNAPISHKKKYELVQGDATVMLPEYLKKHPETIIALAYFDFDLYEPTQKCLEAILPHVTKGTVLAFDELNCPEFPGETLAVKEVIGLSSHHIRRDSSNPLASYIIID